jgi:hypothetical protein
VKFDEFKTAIRQALTIIILGLCRLIYSPHSRGIWTVHMTKPEVNCLLTVGTASVPAFLYVCFSG